MYYWPFVLTHWGRVTHICVVDLTIIGSDNGLSPGRRQVIIWTNARILLIGPPRNKLQWNVNRNSHIFIQENPFENVVWKMAAILSRPQWVKGNQWWLVDLKRKTSFQFDIIMMHSFSALQIIMFSPHIYPKISYLKPTSVYLCNVIGGIGSRLVELEADNPSPLAPDWCCPPSILTQDPKGIRRLDIWKPLVSLVAYLSTCSQHLVMNYPQGSVHFSKHAESYSTFHLWRRLPEIYRKISNIICTKSQNLNDSYLILQLSLPNPLNSGVKSRMKMKMEQRQQATLHLHLHDQQLYCLPKCVLY